MSHNMDLWKCILDIPATLKLESSNKATEGIITEIGSSGVQLRVSQPDSVKLESGRKYQLEIGRIGLPAKTSTTMERRGNELYLYVEPQSVCWEFSGDIEKLLLVSTTYFDSIISKGRLKEFYEKPKHSLHTFFSEHVRDFLRSLQKIETEHGYGERTAAHNRSALVNEQLYQICNNIASMGETALLEIQDRQIRAEVKRTFRELCRPWMKGNSFLERSLSKPRGYPGDYMMMEMGYESDSIEADGLAGGIDKVLFRRYRSVMCRKDKMKECLKISLSGKANDVDKLKVLTLAGGPAREWYELETEVGAALTGKVDLTYLDYDTEALEFSRKRLSSNRLISDLQVTSDSVLTFARSGDWSRERSSYNLIYAIGIADYFPDSLLSEILAKALSLLESNGKLIVAHKDANRFCFSLLDWFCDWTFYRREPEHFSRVLDAAISQLGIRATYIIERDETGEFMFFVVTKK